MQRWKGGDKMYIPVQPLNWQDRGVVEPPPPLGFFILKFLLLNQLPNTFAKLFLDNEDIFWR